MIGMCKLRFSEASKLILKVTKLSKSSKPTFYVNYLCNPIFSVSSKAVERWFIT